MVVEEAWHFSAPELESQGEEKTSANLPTALKSVPSFIVTVVTEIQNWYLCNKF